MKTIAIVVGISDYKNSSFEPLPGAQADAHRFSSALISWGLPKEWIYLALNEQATKENLIKMFYDCRFQFDVDAKLIFYFAGHGVRGHYLNQSTPESSLVLHDTEFADSLATGLRLVDLMQLIRMLKPAQTFLFIDACHLRLNYIENPLNRDVNIFSTTNSKGLFCLFSSGIHQSYEDGELGYGYFTNALLTTFSELRREKQHTCHDIMEKVSLLLKKQGLPSPEEYYIGLENMWPLVEEGEVTVKQPKKIESIDLWRKDIFATIQDCLIKIPDPILWIWGEGGMGKSIIANQMRQENSRVLYASVPTTKMNAGDITKIIITEIKKQMPPLFFNRPTFLSLSKFLSYIIQSEPGFVLILDHLNHLNFTDLKILLNEIDAVRFPCILISRFPCPENIFKSRSTKVTNLSVLAMSIQEIEKILLKNGLNSGYSHAFLHATGGNPLKVKYVLAKIKGDCNLLGKCTLIDRSMIKEYEKALAAISACGGFVDELLFQRIFNINSQVLSTLEKLGLIHYSREGCFPHDIILEIVEKHKWPLDIDNAVKYWSKQVLQTPHNLFSCRSLVILVLQLELEELNKIKRPLSICLDVLNSQSHLTYLKDLAKIFVRANWQDLLVKLTDYLVDLEEFTIAKDLLNILMTSNMSWIRDNAYRINAKRLIWINRLHKCIRINKPIIENCRSQAIVVPIKLNVAMAHFLLGNWMTAKEIVKEVMERKNYLESKELGIAQCLLGTILALSGEAISTGRKLIETSIQIFEGIKCFLFLSIAQNNLGEILWKTGQYRQALVFLETAHEIAEILHHKILLLEILRNKAHVYLRLYGSSDQKLNNLLPKIYTSFYELEKRGDNWEKIRILNTLATLHAYRGETSLMENILEEITPIHPHHMHSHVLTLANLGLLAGLKNKLGLANKYANQAFQIAHSIQHTLIIEQIKQDFRNCSIPLHKTL